LPPTHSSLRRALTPLLGRDLGCRLPIQPGKGYSITMADQRAVRPCRSFSTSTRRGHANAIGFRLGSTMEFAGYDATLNRRRWSLLRERRNCIARAVRRPVTEECSAGADDAGQRADHRPSQ